MTQSAPPDNLPGMAARNKTTGTSGPQRRRSGPSGKHLHARRTLSGIPDEEWEEYGEHAAAKGTTRNEWVRQTLRATLQRERKRKST